jgi:hypothetical protein
MYTMWLLGILGLWLMASTVIGLGENQLIWSTGFTGLVIAIIAFSNARAK